MKRRLFSMLSILSLLLCVVTAGLWLRSHWVADMFKADIRWTNVCVGSYSGFLQMYVGGHRYDSPLYQVRHQQHDINEKAPSGIMPYRYFAHWEAMYYTERPKYWVASVKFPHWLALLIVGVLPVCWVVRWCRHRHHVMEGYCITCGYDLRASKERCPECGTPVKAVTETKP